MEAVFFCVGVGLFSLYGGWDGYRMRRKYSREDLRMLVTVHPKAGSLATTDSWHRAVILYPRAVLLVGFVFLLAAAVGAFWIKVL